MMSPYVLKTGSTDEKGLYFTSLKGPDVHGVFQFKIEYRRLGCTSLSLSKRVINFLLLLHDSSKGNFQLIELKASAVGCDAFFIIFWSCSRETCIPSLSLISGCLGSC